MLENVSLFSATDNVSFIIVLWIYIFITLTTVEVYI